MQSKHLPLLFVLAALAQVLLFDHVEVYYRYATYPYVLALLLLPSRQSPSRSMLLAFGMGMVIDLFASTLGLHAAACTMIASVRRPIIHTIRSRFGHTDSSLPTLQNMGLRWTVQYSFIMSLLHHAIIYILAALPHPQWLALMQQIVASSLITAAIMTIIQLLLGGRRKRER